MLQRLVYPADFGAPISYRGVAGASLTRERTAGGGAVVRTLTGHLSNCVVVDFHPFGEFFASGSMDTNLKIWDIRRKGCIQTYKGHTAGVTHVRFSPDGKWVVSGSEDSRIKLWDLTAGKQVWHPKPEASGHLGRRAAEATATPPFNCRRADHLLSIASPTCFGLPVAVAARCAHGGHSGGECGAADTRVQAT